LNETEGDAAGRDAAVPWWGEKSERLAAGGGGRGRRGETEGGMGVGREARRQKLHDNFSSIDPEV